MQHLTLTCLKHVIKDMKRSINVSKNISLEKEMATPSRILAWRIP